MDRRIPTSRLFGLLRRSTSGVAALEFALILPIMTLFLFGGYEVVRAVNGARRLTILANAIGQQITANTTGTVNNADLHFFYNTAIAVFPDSLKDAARYSNYWWQDINIGMSSVNFVATPTGCTSNCTYTPVVLWTGGSQQLWRSCFTTMQPQSDQASPDPSKLPADVFGPGSIIIVDLYYTFKPSIGANYIPNLVFKRSVYLQPRYVSKINYSGIVGFGADDIAVACSANSQ